MKHTGDNEKYHIKVNRITTENEKLFPYSKYLKNNYSQLSKIAPKNSILYKLKLNPDIVINEFHQTSNNINTNINIKTNQSNNQNTINNNNTYINNISFSDGKNNISSKKNLINNNYINDENNNNQRYFYDKNIYNYEYNSTNLNASEKRIKNKNNYSGVFSPLANRNNVNNRLADYNKNNSNMKNMKYSSLYKNNDIAEFSYIFQSPMNNTRNNRQMKYSNTERNFYNNNMVNNNIQNDNSNINNKYLYANYGSNLNEQKKNFSLDIINTSNALQYNRYNRDKSPSINIYNIIEKPDNYRGESSKESLRKKKMKEMNDIMFSSGNKLNNIFGNTENNDINNNYLSNNNLYNNRDGLNVKLENYRIKLFKVFMKHFMCFIYGFRRKNYIYFFKKLRIYRQRKENSYIYNRKNNYFNNTIDNIKQGQSHLLKRVNRNDLNLLDIFKSSTVKDYYKFYNKLKENHNINPNLKQIFNSTLINNELSDTKKTHTLNKSLSEFYKGKSYLNSAPKLGKNIISLKRNQRKKDKVTTSKSPSFNFGNKTIINNEISFANEGNQKENELYRDSKELNKKYEQIQRRKKLSQKKSNIMNQNMEKNINKSSDIKRIKNTNAYNEFSKLRKNLEISKKDNIKNIKTINIDKNIRNKPQNKRLIKNSSYQGNVYFSYYNNNVDNNRKNDNYKTIDNKKDEIHQNKNDYKYKALYYSNNDKKNNNNIKKENKNKYKEGTTSMIRKKNEKEKIKKKLLNKKEFKEENYNISSINNINNNKESSYKKVKLNSNKKYKITNQQKEPIKKQNNYNIIKQVPNLTNQVTKKNNIYFNKKSTIKNNNTSLLIKNIITKDNRIHININYYKYSTKNNYIKKNFNSLQKSENISICLLGDESKTESSKYKARLYSIKEEDISNQTSKFYDESGTFVLNNNTYESKKNNIISYPNELVYKRFIENVEHLFKKLWKKYFIGRIKSIIAEAKRNNESNELYNKNKDKRASKIYIKKGVVNNKMVGDLKISVINSNKKKEKKYEEKINKFRIQLIKYLFGFSG